MPWFSVAVLAAVLTAEPAGSEADVLTEVRAIAAQHIVRPSPCSKPLPGTWGSRASEPLSRLETLRKTLPSPLPAEEAERWMGVRDGTLPPSELPPRLRAYVEAGRADAWRVLDATCAEQGDLPAEASVFHALDPTLALLPVQDVVKIAIGDARLRSSRDDLRNACLGALAMARDLSGAYLLPLMLSSGLVGIATSTCVETINRATPGELDALTAALRPRSERFELGVVMRQERVFGQLAFPGLSDETVAALPQDARRLHELAQANQPENADAPFAAGARRWLFGGWARRRHFQTFERIIAAARLPPDRAAEELREISTDVPIAFSLMGMPEFGDFGSLVRRAAERHAVVEILAAAAVARSFHRDHGRWPTSRAELAGYENQTQAANWTFLEEDGALSFFVTAAPAFRPGPSPRIRITP